MDVREKLIDLITGYSIKQGCGNIYSQGGEHLILIRRQNKEMHMKRILIIGGTAALLLNNGILSLAILNVATIWAVCALFQAMAERGDRF